MAPPICLAGIRDVDRFPLCRHFFPHWLSLLCTYTCARRFGYPQDTNGILRMPRYPQDASGILRIRYPQDTAVSSGYRVLRIPARVLGYGVPRIPPPILGICRCPQDAPRVPGRQLAFSDANGARRWVPRSAALARRRPCWPSTPTAKLCHQHLAAGPLFSACSPLTSRWTAQVMIVAFF